MSKIQVRKIRTLFGKGAIEILFFVGRTGGARYQEILDQNFAGSRETISNRLVELESLELIVREVKETRPPKVVYRLSPKGQKVVDHLKTISDML